MYTQQWHMHIYTPLGKQLVEKGDIWLRFCVFFGSTEGCLLDLTVSRYKKKRVKTTITTKQ